MKELSSMRLDAVAACLCLAAFGSAQADALTYIGQQHLPTGTLFEGTEIGGLSGIERDPATGR